MESQENRNPSGNETTGDESVEEYERQVEDDPSTAPSDDPQIEEIRGG